MTPKDIEELAITAVKKSILTTSLLSQYISENDKGPSWDGFIYLYQSEQKRKQDYCGRVPVQIKGHCCDDLTPEEIRFPVDRDDLASYACDGGIVFFVTYITRKGNGEKIYYAALTGEFLSSLLKTMDPQQRSKTITLRAFPEHNQEKVRIFRDFNENYRRRLEDPITPPELQPFLPLRPKLATYWKGNEGILSEDRLIEVLKQPGIHVLDIHYGREVLEIGKRLAEDFPVRNYTCEELVDSLVSMIKSHGSSCPAELAQMLRGDANILLFHDLDLLAGKTITMVELRFLFTYLSKNCTLILSGSHILDRCDELVTPLHCNHYTLCR